MEKTWGELMPILEISKDCILSKQGDCTVAFELTKPEIFTLSAGQYEAWHQA